MTLQELEKAIQEFQDNGLHPNLKPNISEESKAVALRVLMDEKEKMLAIRNYDERNELRRLAEIVLGWRDNMKELEQENKSKFYTFRQNNSGGYDIEDDNVQEYVIIEASNENQLKAIADQVFYGYRDYCPCCGPRWDDYWIEWDEATEEPTICHTPVSETSKYNAIIYYLNGRKVRIGKQEGLDG